MNLVDLASGAHYRPGPDYMGSFERGQKQGRLRNLAEMAGQSFGEGQRGQLLRSLSKVDPVKAMQMSGQFATGGRSAKSSVFQQRQAAMQSVSSVREAYDQKMKETAAKLVEDPSANITNDLAELSSLNNQYFEATQKSLPGSKDLRTTLNRLSKTMSQELKGEQFEYKKSEDAEDDLKEDINNWVKGIKNTKEMVSLIEKAKTFIPQARRGNPVAAKNLLAATSRLASNEALSDKEVELVVSGNWRDLLDGWFNKSFGTGAKIDQVSVDNAVSQVGSLSAQWGKRINDKVVRGVARIQRANPDFTEDQVRNRIMTMVSQADKDPVSSIAQNQEPAAGVATSVESPAPIAQQPVSQPNAQPEITQPVVKNKWGL